MLECILDDDSNAGLLKYLTFQIDETIKPVRDFNTTLKDRDCLGLESSPAAAGIHREIVDYDFLMDVWRDHHPDDDTAFTYARVEDDRSRHSWLDRIYFSCFHLAWAHASGLAPFMDHHLVTMTASLSSEKVGPAYWHFSNSLLEDVGFMVSFREFWLVWRGQRCAFPLARLRWDVGNVRMQLFCRDYTRDASQQRDA
ncbi:unnamed protein product [Caretta caretta]